MNTSASIPVTEIPGVHSPFPFRLVTTSRGYIIADALGDSIGALARETGDHDIEEQLENALLFRAAPELRAVVALVAALKEPPPPEAWIHIRLQADQALRAACPNRFIVEAVCS